MLFLRQDVESKTLNIHLFLSDISAGSQLNNVSGTGGHTRKKEITVRVLLSGDLPCATCFRLICLFVFSNIHLCC